MKVPSTTVRLLGTVDVAGAPAAAKLMAQPKLLLVLAFLLTARPRGFHRRERIYSLFWPEQTDDRARASLRNALHSLRDMLGADVILRRGDVDIGIDTNVLRCDAVDFEAAKTAGNLARALELYGGRLLDGVSGDTAHVQHWLDDEREYYRIAAADAAWTLAERYERGSDLSMATRWARKAARLAHSDERRIRKVMSLLHRAGDHAGAMGVYEEFARFLNAELEMQPGPETRALAEAIRGG